MKNKKTRNIWKILLIALVLNFIILQFIPAVSAIGITPGMMTIDYESGLQKQGQFTIVNSEHKRFNALIFVQGDLKDSVWVSQNIVEFDETMNSVPFDYTITLPKEMEKPGDHRVRIVVMEMPPDTSFEDIEGSAIIATTAVVHQVRIKVPYPGKYADLEMHISESMVNEITSFVFPVSNLGIEDISKAKVKVEILGPTNEKIATIESNEESIKSQERKELVAQWKADVNAGFYHAVATLEYDGKLARVEETFSVGNLLVDVNEISVKDYSIGGIAKFNMEIESKWNGNIDGIYAEMEIYDEKGNLITNFKSASIDLGPLEKSMLYAYWDTEGVNTGDYDAKIILHYNDKTTERNLKTHLGLDNIRTDIIGLTGRVTEEEQEESKAQRTNVLLFLLIASLIGINIGWFIYMKKKKRNEKKTEKAKIETKPEEKTGIKQEEKKEEKVEEEKTKEKVKKKKK